MYMRQEIKWKYHNRYYGISTKSNKNTIRTVEKTYSFMLILLVVLNGVLLSEKVYLNEIRIQFFLQDRSFNFYGHSYCTEYA